MTTRYVLGFLFRDNCTSLVLLRKNKPEWQAGLLNGIGGKIEDGETPVDAMVREFKEETGVVTCGWRGFCDMCGDGFIVHCFTARDSDAWEKAASVELERVEKHHPDKLKEQDCVSNLYWLIEMALDENSGNPFFATVRYGGVEKCGDQLERELADCQRMLDETRAMLPTMAQTMVYGSLIRKFKASQAELSNCQKRLEEARWLVADDEEIGSPEWLTRRDALLATFKDKP